MAKNETPNAIAIAETLMTKSLISFAIGVSSPPVAIL